MNFLELNKKAKDIGIANLKKGFDWQAFLVYSVAIMNEEKVGEPVDLVPESRADEGIKQLLNLFVDYVNTKKSYCAGHSTVEEVTEKLEKYLKYNERILKEISLLCDTKEEKSILQNFKIG